MKSHSILALLALTSSTFAAPPTWPAFRGPNCSGLSTGARPPLKISPTDGVSWKVEVPASPSSPSVWSDRIFLTTFADGKLETRAYAAADGKLLWSRAITPEKLETFHQTEGSPAAGTPATDGQHVVSYFGSFGLVAYDAAGKELWRRPLPLADTAGGFGSGTSPMIAGDRVILNRDLATGSHILAVDLRTGKTLWDTPRPDSITSYGCPILWDHDGIREIVMAGSVTMKAYDIKSGAERWIIRGLPSFTCTTPVIGDGRLFFAGWSPGKADSPWPSWESVAEKQDKNGDGVITADEFVGGDQWFKAQDINRNGKLEREDWEFIGNTMKRGENVLLAIKPGGSGDVTDSHVVWKYTKGLPYVPSALFYDGRIYLVRDGGLMSSIDARTGQPAYAQERLPDAAGSYYASPVAADGRVYLASLEGMLTVVKAGGEKPEVLHQAKFGERIAATPALVGDRLYLRTQSKLYAFGAAPTR